MNPLVWLASYPKSGNTWFRLLVDAAFDPDDAALDINGLRARHRIASARRAIDEISLLDSRLLKHREADWLRPGVYEAFAHGEVVEFGDRWDRPASAPCLMKIHDAYNACPDGRPMFAAGRATVLIVRDPRAVATSLASFFNKSVEAAIDQMADAKSALASEITGDSAQVRQTLRDWSSHTASWLDQTDVPVHVVRYEDLKADTLTIFLAAMEAVGFAVELRAAQRAVAATNFNRLQDQERAAGFHEVEHNLRHGALFFRRGESGAWRDELTAAQIARIESNHGEMMLRLGYELQSAPRPRQLGAIAAGGARTGGAGATSVA